VRGDVCPRDGRGGQGSGHDRPLQHWRRADPDASLQRSQQQDKIL